MGGGYDLLLGTGPVVQVVFVDAGHTSSVV